MKLTINDASDLFELRSYSMNINKALIFLHKKFACGVDIKFGVPTATVLVLRETMGQYHLIRQMFGRGMRDHLSSAGVLYTKKPV